MKVKNRFRSKMIFLILSFLLIISFDSIAQDKDTVIYVVKKIKNGKETIIKSDTLKTFDIKGIDGSYIYYTKDDNDITTCQQVIISSIDSHSAEEAFVFTKGGNSFDILVSDSIHNLDNLKSLSVVKQKDDKTVMLYYEGFNGKTDTIIKQLSSNNSGRKGVAYISGSKSAVWSILEDSIPGSSKIDFVEIKADGDNDKIIIIKSKNGEIDTIQSKIEGEYLNKSKESAIYIYADDMNDQSLELKRILEENKEDLISLMVSKSGSKSNISMINNKNLSKDDLKLLKSKGFNLKSENEIELKKLKFHFSKKNDIISLGFTLEQSGDLQLKILDSEGKGIYENKIKPNDGEYSFEIKDIIKLDKEDTYYIVVNSGKKKGATKLVIKKI